MPRRTSRAPLRVLLVDPHEVSRAAIRALLQTEGLDVVADVPTAEQALVRADDLSADVAILDVSQSADAIEIVMALAQLSCLPTVVLTSSSPVRCALDGHPFIAKRDICARALRQAMKPNNPES